MYDASDGAFRYRRDRSGPARRRGDAARWMKYFTYHLAEDDWLTYYMTCAAVNAAAR
jgi:hypothetical protein